VKRMLLAVAAALAVVASASPVHAATVTFHASFKGQYVDTGFWSSDPSGCVVTNVFIRALDGESKTDSGGPEANSFASVQVSRFDQCTSRLLSAVSGHAELVEGDFRVDQVLKAATLETTLELSDHVSGTSFPVDIAVAWTGVGDTYTGKSRSQFRSPGFNYISRISGSTRDATAMGTVTDTTTNFTPEPADFAEIAKVKSGEVIISHQ